MKDFNTNTKNHDEWLTPPYIIKALGEFDLDPCSPGDRRPWDTALIHYGLPLDGLSAPWFGRVWLNPPYGTETFKWLDKLAEHKSGIALIFARTETKGFHRTIWEKAHSVFFFEGRLSFHMVDGTKGATANAPSCLVSYSEADSHAISVSGLKGKQIWVRISPPTM
jgi:hypothetical protein